MPQNLGNYTFATHSEADYVLQEDIALLKNLKSQISTTFRCFSLDSNEFLYMEERRHTKIVTPDYFTKFTIRARQQGRDNWGATACWPQWRTFGGHDFTEKW